MIPDLATHLDLANHHANATPADITDICNKVLQYGFNGAFVNPAYIALTKKIVGDKAKVGTAFSFPLGQDTATMKASTAVESVNLGADELDIVPNNGLLIANEYDMYLLELKQVVTAVRGLGKQTIVKFILETGYFYPKYAADSTDALQAKGDELVKTGARLIQESGADFVKICSGMGPRGASLNDIKLIREVVGNTMRVKVAGGIDTLEEAEHFLTSGADRIGSSKAVEILVQSLSQKNQS